MRSARIGWVLSCLCILIFSNEALAAGQTLQLDLPWQTTGDNTGSVGDTRVTGTSSTPRWDTSFTGAGTELYSRADLWGTNAIPNAPGGDFFVISVQQGVTDTVTITLSGPLVDPLFYISDIDLVGGSVTVTPGGTNFQTNADGQWSGDRFTSLSGVVQGTRGAFGSLQYLGTYGAGSAFVFDWDFSNAGSGGEDVGIGLAVVPEPSAALLLLITLVVITARGLTRATESTRVRH